MVNIVVIDYGIGNIKSVVAGLQEIGCQVTVSAGRTEILGADGVLLPGVGAFPAGMARLAKEGLDEHLAAYVKSGKPLLGICLGMQLLFESSEEHGCTPGLGLIPGRVTELPKDSLIKLPHIDWKRLEVNDLATPLARRLWETSEPEDEFYFVHSFQCLPQNPAHVSAYARYGNFRFCAAVSYKNIMGTQFHPEKSRSAGLRVLSQFAKICLATKTLNPPITELPRRIEHGL